MKKLILLIALIALSCTTQPDETSMDKKVHGVCCQCSTNIYENGVLVTSSNMCEFFKSWPIDPGKEYIIQLESCDHQDYYNTFSIHFNQ